MKLAVTTSPYATNNLAPYLHMLVAILGDRMYLTVLGCAQEAVQHDQSPSLVSKKEGMVAPPRMRANANTPHSIYILAQQASVAYVSYVYTYWPVKRSIASRSHTSSAPALRLAVRAYVTRGCIALFEEACERS